MYKGKLNVIKADESELRKVMNKFHKMRFRVISKCNVEDKQLILLSRDDFDRNGKIISLVAVVRIMNGKITAYRYKTNLKSVESIEKRFIERVPYLLSNGKPVKKEDK